MITRLATLLLFIGLTVQAEKATVEGVVRATGSEVPLADAEVTAVPFGTGASPATVKTDAEGHFTLSLTAGPYRLTVRQTGYVSQSFGQRSQSSLGTTVQLQAGNKLTDIVFHLVPTGTIVGRVYDPDGKPMEGVSINILKRGWDNSGRRTLVSNGLGSIAPSSRVVSPGLFRQRRVFQYERHPARRVQTDRAG